MKTPLRVIVADIIPKDLPKPNVEKHFAELVRLVETLGGMTVVKIIQKRGRPSGKTFLGTGKAVEVGAAAAELKCDAVVVNGILKGNQIYELTQQIPVVVWDRVDVILRIFEKHASTTEAKLQVKRARLRHDIPKLYRPGGDNFVRTEARRRSGLPTVALVGYTNFGKSTLLKKLTGKWNIFVADKFFATLDPRLGS